MKAPFPWFGGKSICAPLAWDLMGEVPNYVEPFAGSLAILLGRPHRAGIETVNDKDCFLANFWRSVSFAAEETARWADWPVNEADKHARHLWLVNETAEFRQRMRSDPEFYDPKIAGWWVWGLCTWIGGGWCAEGKPSAQLPHLGDAGRGVHRPSQQLPHLGSAGMGVHRASSTDLYGYFAALQARLRRVRVCCGDFERVLGPTPTVKQGLTGVVLDPPYSLEAGRDMGLYAEECGEVAHRAREWAIANGDNPKLRILLFGYEGEHEMPDGWTKYEWKARGGYGSRANGTGRANANRERIWASPHCLRQEADMPLFAGVAE